MIDLAAIVRTDFLLLFGIGLLGGVHCVGMCGPLIMLYDGAGSVRTDGGASRRPSRRAMYRHGLFNLGRTVSYATLGGLFGALGGVLYVTTDSVLAVTNVVRGSVGVALGVLVIGLGLGHVVGKSDVGLHSLPLPGLGIDQLLRAASCRIDDWASGRHIFGLGLAHGLLPCPMLYSAFVYSFAIGSPATGAAALTALGLGTFPAVFLYGTAINSLDPLHTERLHRALGIVFVALGYVLVAHGLMALGVHVPHPMLPHAELLAAR